MGKWYEVKVTTVTVFAVEVADTEGENEAMKCAADEASNFDDMECSDEITGEVAIDRLRRHADEIFDLA